MIPFFMHVKIIKTNQKRVRIFIPLILIWIVMFAFYVAAAPFVMIAAVILWQKGYGKILLIAYPMLFSLVCSLSGLCIQLKSVNKEVSIFIK